MPKVLIIAEKPSVSQDLAWVLLRLKARPAKGNLFRGAGPDGSEITISSARGHLMELAKPEAYNEVHGKDYRKWLVADLPILPRDGWDFIQVPRGDSKDLIDNLCRLAADHSGGEIINACDAGREGELIFRKILAQMPIDRKTTRLSRMWWSSMASDAIHESFAKRHPLTKYDGLARAGYTRDEADWLVGMNMTVLATKTLPRGGGDWNLWSVGRVQTPTLALVVERDLAIEKFTTEAFYEVSAVFDGLESKAVLDKLMDSPDRAKLLGAPKISEDLDKKAFWSRGLAERFASSARAPASYKATDKATERTSTSLPLSLQEAQKELFKNFGLSADESLGVLQKLYETHKLVSYPRTDSRYFPEDMRAKIYQDTCDALEGVAARYPHLHLASLKMAPRSVADKSRAFNSKEVGDHYALCPTGSVEALGALNDIELKTYLTVLQATLMALDAPCRVAVVTRRFVQQGGEGAYAPAEFRATAERVIEPGGTRWLKKASAEKSPLPALPPGQIVQIGEVRVNDLKTNPPKPFGDDTLLTAMERAGTNLSSDEVQDGVDVEAMVAIMKGKGIGTAATRAATIKTLETRRYIERQSKRLVSTPLGRMLIQSMNALDPASTSAAMTAEWEMVLQRMENGENVSREEFLDGLLRQFLKTKETFVAASSRKLDGPALTEGTPIAGALCPKSGKPLLDRGAAYEAPGFNGVLLWKTGFGKEWSPGEFVQLLKGVMAGKPVTFAGLKTKQGKEYSAPLTINAEAGRVTIHEISQKVKGVKCPKKGTLIEDRGNYWIAGGWPNLKLYKQAFGREWKLEEYVAVLESNHKGAPMLVRGLISKGGKPYEAKLIAGANKWELEFPARQGGHISSPAHSDSGESWENARPVARAVG